ncbi:MAG: class I SAM-dependent methyltransferase, partial [Undibacterium sp.]|nr:class I SAM-dependent methyltransferase [Undibacterium sp.]
MTSIASKEITKKIAGVPHWYHQIRFPDGSVTPGVNNSAGALAIYDELGLPKDLSGKRVLDIGCADGYISFLAESRGAEEVIAIDYRLPTASGFSVAAEILGSK